MKKIVLLASWSILVIAGCQKADFDNTVTGEGLNAFALTAPASNTIIVLNGATPAAKIEINWNAAKPGVDVVPAYKWVAALKNGGSLEAPFLELPSDNNGKDTRLTLTQKQLDDALKAKNIADGATTELIWSIKADNGSVQLLSSDTRNLTITRMKDGATAFILLGPVSAPEVKTIDPNSSGQSMVFNWTRSLPAPGGSAMKYKVLFAERKLDSEGKVLPVDWTSPLFAITADNNGSDSLAAVVYKALSDSLTDHGFENQEQSVDLLWTTVATSGTWTQYADYVNQLVILREIKVYLIGSATPADWTIENASRLIPDPRFPGTFFTYVTLKAGEFKFVNGLQWPPAPGAIDWGQDPAAPAGAITDNGEQGIPVATPGIYRITFDYANKKYYLQSVAAGGIGALGIVGSFQGWNENANVRMSNLGPNKMIVFQDLTTNDGLKFHDGNVWNNSANDKARWFGLPADGSTKLVVDDGSKKELKYTGATGRARVIFDGTDVKDLKYNLSPATEMRVVGNGLANYPEWNPGASPQMTWIGNGKWQITVDLLQDKEIKFLSGNDWGFFDYEDAGNGKIRHDGTNNFKVPGTSKSYTITLDELNGTVTIL